MSKIFNHTVQPLGSTTSPVEDLALEVEDAFTEFESVIDVSDTVISNFGDTIGNPTFESIDGHGINKNVSETHNLLSDESNIILENVPNTGSLTLTYTNNIDGSITQLVNVPFDQDFTDKNQYKIAGKYVILNIRIPNKSSLSVTATYKTRTFTLGGKQFLSNVITKDDGTFEITPELLNTNTYILKYETQIKDNPEKHFSKTLKFFYRESTSSEYKKLNVNSFAINAESITLITQDMPQNLSNIKVISFCENTDISTLLDALYKEFKEHTHSKEEMSLNIETKDLANRFINTDKISYKDDNLENYLFPQYFNREGYNPDLDAVYENAILGDIFISRVISDTVQKYKGLDADSNAIIFGDPVRGHKVRYSRQDDALTLTSMSPSNGLKIITEPENKYGLILNNSKFKSTKKGLEIEPSENELFVKSVDPTKKYTSNFDKIVSTNAVLTNTVATKISINDINIIASSDSSSAEFLSSDNTKKVIFSTPLVAKRIIVDTLESPNEVVFSSVKNNWIKFDDIHFKLDVNKNLIISDEGNPKNKKIKYTLPTEFIGRLTAHHITPNTINFGNIVFNVDDDTLGLNIWSTVPDQSYPIFKSLVKFTGGLEVSNAKGNFQVGDIYLKKSKDSEDLVITSKDETSEMLIEAKARFKNLVTDNDSEVNLAKIKVDESIVGKVTAKKIDEQLHIIHTDNVEKDGRLVVDVPTNLKDVSYTTLRGPSGSTATMDNLEVSSLTIGGVVISKGGQLTGNTPSTGNTTTTTPTNSGTVASPVTPGASLTFAAKIDANELEAENIVTNTFKATGAEITSLKIGDSTLSADANKNMTLSSTVDSTKFVVTVPTDYRKLYATEFYSPKSNIQELTSDKIVIGNISFTKENNNAVLDKVSTNGILKINTPTEAADFIATNFGTTNDATMKNIFGTNITVNGVTWSSNTEGNSIIDSENSTKKVIFKLSVLAEEIRNVVASSAEYRLLPDDRIQINADNYITNYNGKLVAKLNKGLSYVGSGKETGSKYLMLEDSLPSMKQYIASNTGSTAIDSEKNAFIELDVNDGLYLLQPTNKKIQSKGTIYGFNDATAPNNISDLRKWLRAPLYAGKIEGDSLNLGMVDSYGRNGLSIGETRISVIGPGTDCPTGLTTFESGETIHFVAPLAKDNTCRNLTYQEVSTGPLNIKGDGSVDSSFTISDDLMVGGTSSATNLDITDTASISKITVSSELTSIGPVNFKNTLKVSNNLSLDGNLISIGNIETKNLKAEQDIELGRDLRVGNDIYVGKDVVIEGSLAIEKGFQTGGMIKGHSLEVQSAKMHAGEVLTTFRVAGETTVGGKLNVNSSTSISSNLNVGSNLEVKESIVTTNLYTIKDVTVREKLGVFGNVDLNGTLINIGGDTSKIQISGKLAINTDDLSINSPVKIFNTLRVSDRAEFSSEVLAKAGIITDAGITAKGSLKTESSLDVGSSITAKSMTLDQDLKVNSSIIANSLTSESLIVEQRASISNLAITGSLTMPIDTTIVAGNIKVSAITQTDSNVVNNFSGGLFVAKKLEAANDIKINGHLTFDNGELQISTLGIKGTEAIIDVNKIKAEVFTGSNRIQPPSELATSGVGSANVISSLISNASNYIRLDNSLFEGISVFSQPIVAGTIYYTDLINIRDRAGTGMAGAVNLIAKYALYG